MSFLRNLFASRRVITPLHRLHPLNKLLLLICFSFIPLIIENPGWQIPFLATVIILSVLAKVDFKTLRLYYVGIAWLSVFTLLIYTFIGGVNGKAIFQFFWVAIYPRNLIFGLGVSLKLAVMATTTALFLSTTPIREVIIGFRAIRLPYLLSFTLSLAVRATQMFATDAGIISEAVRTRGLDFSKGSLVKRAMKLGNILMPLTVIAIKRTDSITNAIELRAFTVSNSKRTFYFSASLTAKDAAISFVLLGMVIVVGFLRYYFHFFTI